MEEALDKHDYKATKRLLAKDKKKKILQQKYQDGKSALHIACENGDYNIAKALIKHKADVNETNENKSALQLTCSFAFLDLIALLLSNNADVTLSSSKGNSPLHLLIANKPTTANLSDFYHALEQMKAAGANINLRNNRGDTPLHYACLKGSEKNAMWLIREGADVSICNGEGETALHYAARFSSVSFVSLLLSAGASPIKRAKSGLARDYAETAGRPEIVKVLDDAAATFTCVPEVDTETMLINGVEINEEKWNHYKQLLFAKNENKEKEVKANRNRSKSVALASDDVDAVKRNHLLLQIMQINSILFREDELNEKNSSWSGILRFADSDESVSEYCNIVDGEISVLSDNSRNISLKGVVSLRAYSEANPRFSIIYTDESKENREFSAKPALVPAILKVVVQITKHTIEYLDDRAILTMLQELDFTPKLRSNPKSIGFKKRRTFSAGVRPILSKSGSRIGGQKPKRTKTGTVMGTEDETVIIGQDGYIMCDCDFSVGAYENAFDNVTMAIQTNCKYLLTSGSLCDLLNYCILHSGQKLFNGNSDVKSFYLCYYRCCEPQEIITAIESLWENHVNTFWPSPYYEIAPDARLFGFLKGFIESPFVLIDSEKEVQFREDLVSLYGRLIQTPSNESRTQSHLRKILEAVKKARLQASVNQLCDLKSLLGDIPPEEQVPFHIYNLNPEDVATQIVYINADLYKQLQLTELLDLRYQKDENFAVSLNKVHAFSNKIYSLVPSTILQTDDIELQQISVKRWIAVAEYLCQLRDYNSAVQVINGITSTSVSRLPHLNSELSMKWSERLEKMEEQFAPDSNFMKYRRLPMESPCIPFVGVALKDLVYAYEGNPNRVDTGAINFTKMRIITQIILSLTETDYSYLKFNPQIAQALLNASPMDQESLYSRSMAISESIKAQAKECEDNALLRKDNKQLREELDKLRRENVALKDDNLKKDELIKYMKWQIMQKSSGPAVAVRVKPKKRKASGSMSDLDPITVRSPIPL